MMLPLAAMMEDNGDHCHATGTIQRAVKATDFSIAAIIGGGRQHGNSNSKTSVWSPTEPTKPLVNGCSVFTFGKLSSSSRWTIAIFQWGMCNF